MKYYCLLVVLVTFQLVSFALSQQQCKSPVVAEVGSRLKIPCEFEAFHSVDWFNGRKEADSGSPFISFETLQTGLGYISGEFNVHLDGSLIINNVSLSHDHIFTAVYYRRTDLTAVMVDVYVEVFVPPEPRYPVVEVNFLREDVANLSCFMRRVRPNVGLQLSVVNDNQDSVKKSNFTVTPNDDGTFDLEVVGQYVINHSSPHNVPVLECKLVQQLYETYLKPAAVTILIPTAPSVPVVDGCYSQQEHCSLIVEQTGQVTCTVKGNDVGSRLHWETDTGATSKHFVFSQDRYRQDNQESIVASYIMAGNTLGSVNLRCVMSRNNKIQSVAMVTLLIHPKNSTEKRFDPGIDDMMNPPKPIERATMHLLWVFIAAAFVGIVMLTASKIYKINKERKRRKMLKQLFAQHVMEAISQVSQSDTETRNNVIGPERFFTETQHPLDAHWNTVISQCVDHILREEALYGIDVGPREPEVPFHMAQVQTINHSIHL